MVAAVETHPAAARETAMSLSLNPLYVTFLRQGGVDAHGTDTARPAVY